VASNRRSRLGIARRLLSVVRSGHRLGLRRRTALIASLPPLAILLMVCPEVAAAGLPVFVIAATRPLLRRLAEKRTALLELTESIHSLDTFAAVYSLTGSAQIASQHAACSRTRVSNRFREALTEIRNGTDPGTALIASFQGSPHYTDWLRSVIYGEACDASKLASLWDIEAASGLSKVEDVAALFTASAALLPIALAIMGLVWGWGTSPRIFLLVAIQGTVIVVFYLWLRDLVQPVI